MTRHRLTCISCHHQEEAPFTFPQKCPLCGDLMMIDRDRRRLLTHCKIPISSPARS